MIANHRKLVFLLAVLAIAAAVMQGCKGGDNGEVVARVNGEPITRYELDNMVIRTLGYEQGLKLDDAGRKKVLESMVISRAMAEVMEKELSDEDRKKIEKDVAAYREQLLVKRYLRRHATPEGVTQAKIQEYYEAHPERFGGGMLRHYEMILGTEKLQEQKRNQLIGLLGSAGKKKNWKSLATGLRKQGYPVSFRTGVVDEKVLHPRLYALFKSLKLNEASNVTFIEGKPYLARVVSETKQQPRPLNEVRTEIRKVLALLEIKKATKEVADGILRTVKVEYTN